MSAASDNKGGRRRTAAGDARAAADIAEEGAAAVGEHLDALRQHAQEAQAAASQTAQSLGAVAQQQLAERPYVALAAVAAGGFVLGGGLGPRLLGTLARHGGRWLLGRAVRAVLSPSE